MAKEKRISAKELESDISSKIEKAFKLEYLEPYRFEFRSSRLPICSREYVIHNRYREETPLRGEGYQFRFYVDIGTAVHEVIQTYLGMANLVYGDWTCCGVSEHGRLGSKLCDVCGRPQKYLELAPSSPLGMHVDGVSVEYNAVIEYKTTSSKNIVSLVDPYPKHMVQASCYAFALNKSRGWSLDKLIFVYLSRDNPADFKVFVRPPNLNEHDDSIRKLEEADIALRAGILPEKECDSTWEGKWRGCPYVPICFSDTEKFLIPASSLARG